MTNSFDMYEGEDAEPYYPVEDSTGTRIDLSDVEEVTFVAADTDGSVFLTLHLSDDDTQISIDYDQEDKSPSITNTIFVHLISDNTDGRIGTWRHEVAVLLAGRRTVVFQATVGEEATFGVVESLTWNETTHLPRLMRVMPKMTKATRMKLWPEKVE